MSRPAVKATKAQRELMKTELKSLLDRCGGAKIFSERFDVNYHTVCGWVARGYVPLSAITQLRNNPTIPAGLIDPVKLRPDIVW